MKVTRLFASSTRERYANPLACFVSSWIALRSGVGFSIPMFDCSQEPVTNQLQSPLAPAMSAATSRWPRLPMVRPTLPDTPSSVVGVWMSTTPAVRYPYCAGSAPVITLT